IEIAHDPGRGRSMSARPSGGRVLVVDNRRPVGAIRRGLAAKVEECDTLRTWCGRDAVFRRRLFSDIAVASIAGAFLTAYIQDSWFGWLESTDQRNQWWTRVCRKKGQGGCECANRRDL